jgi:TRAP transporter TAXI family solute receptor
VSNGAADHTLKWSGLFGAWGSATLGIQQALALDGIKSEMMSPESARDTMAAMDRLEAQLEQGQRIPKFDEAGMLFVDNREVDLSVNFTIMVDWAFNGLFHHAAQPHRNLRALARIVQPQYGGIAATEESGITSLEQVARERRPIRLYTISRSKHQTRTMGLVLSRVLEESGFTQADVESWGGQVFTAENGLQAIRERSLDLIALPAYSRYGMQWGIMWMEAQINLNLRFLPVADHVLETLESELHAPRGVMPAGLFKGVAQDTPTFVVADHTVVTHDQLSDADAYAVVKAIDQHSECLALQADMFAFHPREAWKRTALPLHPGAEAYYREQGYLTGSLAAAGS